MKLEEIDKKQFPAHYAMHAMQRLEQVIADNSPCKQVTPETRLDSLGVDSLEFLALMLEVQKTFNITIPDAEYASLNTVGDIMRHLA